MIQKLLLISRNAIILTTILGIQAAKGQVAKKEVQTELLKLEHALNYNVMKHDTAVLSQILANEFQLTGPKFSEGTQRAEWLSYCPKITADSVTITDATSSNWGDIAVFRSFQHFYNLLYGGEPGPYHDAWITDLWMKRDGKWQLVTRISERLPKK